MALSQCCRALIPLRALLIKLSDKFTSLGVKLLEGPSTAHNGVAVSTVNGDNEACLQLTIEHEKYSPRTKHIGIKWHHMRDKVKDGSIRVAKVHTSVNWSDIFTKPLPRVRFEELRLLMMNW
jgi:hypothetical protein